MSTLLQFTTASGLWETHYWVANETLSSDGNYVEFVVAEVAQSYGFGISQDGDGSPTRSYYLWYNSGTLYLLLNGGINQTFTGRSFSMFDRFRFRKSGSNVIISQNGTDFHTFSLSGTLYAYAASYNGTGSVDIDSVNGSAVTTKVSAACTVTIGVPSTDTFASGVYFTPIAWTGSGRYRASSQPGAAMRFSFTGTKAGIIFDASSQVSITSTIRTKLAYRIDGGAWSYHQLTTPELSYLEIATGLSSGTHTAEVLISSSYLGARYGATNRYAEVLMYGARVPTGQTVTADTAKPLLIVGYTDSNGEGAESNAGVSAQPLAFTQLMADCLNADLAISSVPGQGWITTPDAGIPTMQNGWDLYPDGSTKLPFATEPDLIFIVHGQNDSSSVTSAATSVVNEMLAATTSTKIVVCCPCGRHRRSELIAAVAAVNNSRCTFVDNPTDWLDDYSYTDSHVHLLQSGQALYATTITPPISELIGGTVDLTEVLDAIAEVKADTEAILDAIGARVYPPLYRSADDQNPILFWWPTSGDTITGTVIKTSGGTVGSSQSVQGAITSTGRSANGEYEYKLAYDADDRPAAEGVAQYVLTGGSFTGYLTLEVTSSGGGGTKNITIEDRTITVG